MLDDSYICWQNGVTSGYNNRTRGESSNPSELAVAAGTVAKLFDPNVVRANVAYPLDLAGNSRYDLSRFWRGPAVWLANRPKESKLKK